MKFSAFVQTCNSFSSGQGSILWNQCHRYICCTLYMLYVDNFCKIYPFLVLVNHLEKLFPTWLLIKNSIYGKNPQFQPIFVQRSNGLCGFISPNSILLENHFCRQYCRKSYCCWYVTSKIFLFHPGYPQRSLVITSYHNEKHFYTVKTCPTNLSPNYCSLSDCHYYAIVLGETIVLLDLNSQNCCRPVMRICSPWWNISDSMSSLEMCTVSCFAFSLITRCVL